MKPLFRLANMTNPPQVVPQAPLPSIELRVFTEPQQGATYDELLRVAKAAEEFGYAEQEVAP